jgi:CxxC-x17-CxxC domain-containing protein
MEIQDRTIKCATCGRDFLFTAKEQEFFVNKGLKEPRHCRECRQHRKQERDLAIAQATGQPAQPGRELFQVICANCRRETAVPFKPITGKPVLCKDCFIAQRYGGVAPALTEPQPPGTVPSPTLTTTEKEPGEQSEAAPAEPPEDETKAPGVSLSSEEGEPKAQGESPATPDEYAIAAKKYEG